MRYIWQGNFKYYFGLDCIKRFASDLLEIETENNFKRNKQMIFNEEDNLDHETNNTCHIFKKTCINKVRHHCHETGKYRGPTCKICNLRCKQQNFIPVIFHNGSGYDLNLLNSELFKQNNDKRKVDNIPLAASKSKMFRIGCLKFLDSYNFLAIPLDQMAKIYGCKSKTLCPYECFGLDSYDEVIGNLKIEDFKSSLSNKLQTQEEVDIFNKDKSHKTGKDLFKISLNTFDDKRFYVNNIKSYPHDENLYLFKRGLINKICEASSPIKNASVNLLRRSLDGDKDLLVI